MKIRIYSIFIALLLCLNTAFADQYEALEITDWSPDLMETMTDIPGYNWEFTVYEPSILKVSGHIDTHHRGLYGTENGPVMVAFQVKINNTLVRGSKTGANIVSEKQHYAIIPMHGYHFINPGTHTLRVQGRSASTAAAGKNGLAEIKAGYNQVVYEVYPQ